MIAQALNKFYLPVTPLLLSLYLVWGGWVLHLPLEVWSILMVFLFGLLTLSHTVFLGEQAIHLEPIIGILFFGIFRKSIDYHDILRVRFHRNPFPLGLLFDQIDLVTPRGTQKLFRVAGRRTWNLQRHLMRKIPEKISWRPAPPSHVNARYDL